MPLDPPEEVELPETPDWYEMLQWFITQVLPPVSEVTLFSFRTVCIWQQHVFFLDAVCLVAAVSVCVFVRSDRSMCNNMNELL